jgi:two-component system chemotaxis response regulator CheY|nr:response regulator [Kofleriaceae bacterium]
MACIMVIDDSSSMRALVKQTLAGAGHQIVEACDGLEALDKLRLAKVELVLCDVNMPRLDGLGFVRQARALPACKFTPILMLTTEVDPEKKRIAKEAGATGWLVKPFQPAQLLATIGKVLT